jgi:fermentation-respiration switch protein FrsA (DUF1100 family)
MRRDVAFDAEGTLLRGWLYVPEGASVPVPAVVMAHGFGAVKEQLLDRYAEVFCSAGLGALVFDHRNFGASDGEPRQEIDPMAQVRDYRHAITFVRTLADVDQARIGVWGTSLSGGHALAVAASDRRVRCVVAQVPAISGPATALRRTPPDRISAILARFDADREARFRGEPPAMIPVVAEEALAPCALAGGDAWEFFTSSGGAIPTWQNEVTLRSLEMVRDYEPGTVVRRISPTPLLLIVATHDTLTPTDLALDAYERALPPKKLVLLSGGHFVAYDEQFAAASGAARDWFVGHLAAPPGPTHARGAAPG